MKESVAGYTKLVSKLRLVIGHVSQGFSFIVAPHGTGTTVTFNLPGRVATAVLILIIVLMAAVAFVGVTYTRLAVLALETSRLKAENEALREDNQKITELEQEVIRIDNMRRQIEAWAGVVPGKGMMSSPVSGYALTPNVWPRRYTYAIMRPFYTERAPYPHGMVAPAAGWVSRRFMADGAGEPAHPGVDIAASAGTPVRCALDGTVKSARWDDIYGNVIVVEHNDSLSTVYGHNEKMLVKEGEYVAKGQVIATIGSTGRSTAPHLHFEVLKGLSPVDPELYVKFDND
jgi:murein DD-endopeptidase MepM/ murein hydrolase activator NlpD